MNTEIVVPWRATDDPWRDSALEYVRAHWGEVTVAEIDGEWRKGRAVNLAVERSTADVIVVSDADVFCDHRWVRQAAVSVHVGDWPWAKPHGQVRRLDAPSTRGVLAGGRGGNLCRPAYRGVAGGGMVVARRDTLAAVPMDERFTDWGGQDWAWGWALDTLAGPHHRGPNAAVLWHLWHRPQARKGNNTAVIAEYRAALGDPAAMAAVVRRARWASPTR